MDSRTKTLIKKEELEKLLKTSMTFSTKPATSFSIKDVIFNDPAVIVLWNDGTKTVVKCSENDIFDPEKGMAMAIAKKALGNQGNYYETFKKYLPEEGDIDDFGLHPFESIGGWYSKSVGVASERAAASMRDLINSLKKQTSETPEPTHLTVAYDEPYHCATCKYLCQSFDSMACFGCGLNKKNWEPADSKGDSK